MRYKIFVTDFDGTIAEHGKVSPETIKALEQLRRTSRKLVLVTGREMNDLEKVFPEHAIFDYIIAENGAVIRLNDSGSEELTGPPPDPQFIRLLQEKNVTPISVGKVIIATWEPNDKIVLEAIKEFGIEYQVIFNKGAVMILPPGINKASGLLALLEMLNISIHNTISVGDAENDSALLQVTECSAAVANALSSVKELVDMELPLPNGRGVSQLIHHIIKNDLSDVEKKLTRHNFRIGSMNNLEPFSISPFRSGILLSGASGGGKSTLTAAVTESLKKSKYQFCLIDPEGDYLELPDVIVIGNESSMPSLDEIRTVLKNPAHNVVICTLSIPLDDRPSLFFKLLTLIQELRLEFAHPHWVLIDEAHHLVPSSAMHYVIPEDFKNFFAITTVPDALRFDIIQKVGLVIMVGEDASTPMREFASKRNIALPDVPRLKQGEALVWDLENNHELFLVQPDLPSQLQQRHKRKYAQGDLKDKSFLFTGKENKLKLRASNLMMFAHIAEGIDDDTWQFHLRRKDFTKWFKDSIKDDELAQVSELANQDDAKVSKKQLIDFINEKYTM